MRQRARFAIHIAHRLDILTRISEKALPLRRTFAWVRAFDAEHSDQRFAIFLFAGAAEIARCVFEIGRQVGNAGLDHRIDDAFRREEGESKRGVIPDGSVEACVPCGKGFAALVGSTQLVRRTVPIEDRAIGVPGQRRRITDRIG